MLSQICLNSMISGRMLASISYNLFNLSVRVGQKRLGKPLADECDPHDACKSDGES
jgi:hypothetical protein